MRTEIREIQIKETEQGERLDVFLTRRHDNFSRTEWQQRIDDGFVRINGTVARRSRRLNQGDMIEFSYTTRDEPEVNADIRILFEDEDYLVINKPPGIPVHPSGIYRTRAVTNLLVEQGLMATPHLLHRLDRETSGVLALGKTRKAASEFQKVLRSGAMEKGYLVAVEGDFTAPLDARGYIYRLPDSALPRQRFYKEENPPENAIEPQTCRTVFTPMQHKGGMTLIEVKLFTGRMHQIRATLFSLGYPVVGDKLYGVDGDFYFKFADDTMTASDWERLRIDRCALHCETLNLPHPLSKERWRLYAPLPDDMSLLFP
jgi:23S rRNA pseudouridine1911/1915/1917 synthase